MQMGKMKIEMRWKLRDIQELYAESRDYRDSNGKETWKIKGNLGVNRFVRCMGLGLGQYAF